MNKHNIKTISKTTHKNDIFENLELHNNLKKSSYQSSIKRIRKQLPKKRHRAFSSFIHARGMDTTHEYVINTISRPYSILVGSIFAFIGTWLAIYLSMHNSYSYNYLLFFIFFIIGYFVETVFEIIIKVFVKYK